MNDVRTELQRATNDEQVHSALWEAEVPLTLAEIAKVLGVSSGSNWPSVRAMLRLTLYRLQEAGRAEPDKTGRGGSAPQRWVAT